MSIDTMKGATLMGIEGLVVGSDEVVFRAEDGRGWQMYHAPDCCESVSIEDVAGEPADLIGSPILMAEEVSSPEPEGYQYGDDSHTWTFYKLATIKGYVTIRWLGESNGYYGEEVTVRELRP